MIPDLEISQRLTALASNELSDIDKHRLKSLINQVFYDLDKGHSCTNLVKVADEYTVEENIQMLLKSTLAKQYTGFPTQLEALPISILSMNNQHLVYITKYLHYELIILDKIRQLKAKYQLGEDIAGLIKQINTKNTIPNDEQCLAIKLALCNQFSIITGGPGSGKTTTVAVILSLLYRMYETDLKIKICAPTGKASNRLIESIAKAINNKHLDYLELKKLNSLLADKSNFLTIHKLLKYIPHSIYFRHNEYNLLDLDVLIIDESSMISLPLFSKLLKALDCSKIKHLILLGDKNQLSSVEEGYVFASLVNSSNLSDQVSYLSKSNRSNQEIANFMQMVYSEEITKLGEVLTGVNSIRQYPARLSYLFERQLFRNTDNSLIKYFEYIAQTDFSNISELFDKFNQQCTLCLTNSGIFGTTYLNAEIERQVKLLLNGFLRDIQPSLFSHKFFPLMDGVTYTSEWYSGRPIIILENDYNLELFNGDIGICVIEDNKISIVFSGKGTFAPEVLPKYQVAYAITVHKAQGSEYEHVNLILGENHAIDTIPEFLTKELVYTGVSRAKTSISIFAGDKVLPYALLNKTIRNTGLDLLTNV